MLPSMKAMREIEASSRLFQKDGVVYMTSLMASQRDHPAEVTMVGFILKEDMLITLRHMDSLPFQRLHTLLSEISHSFASGLMVFVTLLEGMIDHLADILEACADDLNQISALTFSASAQEMTSHSPYKQVLMHIGQRGNQVSQINESLFNLERIVTFIPKTEIFLPHTRNQEDKNQPSNRSMMPRFKTLRRDVLSLQEYSVFLSGKLTFLLDATLGFIGIEQNATIKIFSVLAVIFMPPTLIASIYGMNFGFMPELNWPWGYPLAITIMTFSALLTHRYFKRRNWL